MVDRLGTATDVPWSNWLHVVSMMKAIYCKSYRYQFVATLFSWYTNQHRKQMLIFHVVCFYFITTLKYIPVNILVVTLVCQARTANVPNPDKEEITTKRPSGKLLQISILMMAKYVYTNLLIFCSLEFHNIREPLQFFCNVSHGYFYF